MTTLLSTRKLDENLKKEASKWVEEIIDENFLNISYLKNSGIIRQISTAFEPFVFTSSHAILALNQVGKENNLNMKNKNCFCISGVTRQTAFNSGFIVIGEAKNGENLGLEIVKQKIREIFYFTGNFRRDELIRVLKKNNIRVNEIQLYRKEHSPRKVNFPYNGILFFSPSQIDSFKMENSLEGNIPAFCIGETTASHLRKKNHRNIIVAKEQNEESVIRAACDYFKKAGI